MKKLEIASKVFLCSECGHNCFRMHYNRFRKLEPRLFVFKKMKIHTKNCFENAANYQNIIQSFSEKFLKPSLHSLFFFLSLSLSKQTIYKAVALQTSATILTNSSLSRNSRPVLNTIQKPDDQKHCLKNTVNELALSGKRAFQLMETF